MLLFFVIVLLVLKFIRHVSFHHEKFVDVGALFGCTLGRASQLLAQNVQFS